MIGAVIQFRSLLRALSDDLSGSSPFSRRRVGLLARVFTLLVVWPVHNFIRGDWPAQFFPVYSYLGERLRAFDIPGWNPHQFAGSPFLGDFPLASRTRTADVNQPLDNMVAQVEAHLEKNPTDGRGWTVLAPVLARLGRYDDAVRAYRNSITYAGDSAERRSDLGEALAGAAGGVVTAEAKAEFERAAAQNADEPKASYFLGLAAEQDGRQADAATIWRGMLAKAPADAPWRPLIEAALARVGGPAVSVLSNDTMAAAKDMTAEAVYDAVIVRSARHPAEAKRP